VGDDDGGLVLVNLPKLSCTSPDGAVPPPTLAFAVDGNVVNAAFVA